MSIGPNTAVEIGQLASNGVRGAGAERTFVRATVSGNHASAWLLRLCNELHASTHASAELR